jgi:hypothetical protein
MYSSEVETREAPPIEIGYDSIPTLPLDNVVIPPFPKTPKFPYPEVLFKGSEGSLSWLNGRTIP